MKIVTNTFPVSINAKPFEFFWRLIIWPLSDRPAMNKSLSALKTKLERPLS
jgi:hypothetical protein